MGWEQAKVGCSQAEQVFWAWNGVGVRDNVAEQRDILIYVRQ